MTTKQYLKYLLENYSLISTLSDKNNCTIYKLRNKSNSQNLIARIFKKSIFTYQELLKIEFENLPLIYDVIECDDGQIVLEEYIDGITLAESMECQKFNYKNTKKIIKPICCALMVLHERGFIHRDVKPENVMIDKNGRVVLIDFNTARKTNKAGKDTVIMGTVGYAAPEQLGLRESLPQTDIYALGIMLNVMITGKHPTEQIAKGKAGKIVRKCTNVNPEERYKNIESLIMAL